MAWAKQDLLSEQEFGRKTEVCEKGSEEACHFLSLESSYLVKTLHHACGEGG